MPESEPINSRGLVVHRGHKDSVHSVAFSPDGKSVASGSADTSIRIWDAHRPVPIGSPLNGHTNHIWSICYSPCGSTIASGSGAEECAVRLWNTQTGQQVGDALKGHTSGVMSVAFSSGGNLIASGSNDATIRLWNVQGSTTISGLLEGHTRWVSSVAFSPDGTRVISGSGDKTVRMWDAKRRSMVGGALRGHENTVLAVSFSPDGSQIVSGSYDKTLRLWDVRTGNTIGIPLEGHTAKVWSVAFSPSGTYVASASDDKTVRIWDTRTHRQAEVPFKQHISAVYSVAFSSCGRRIVSGADDNTVMVWNISTNNPSVNYNPPDLMEENNKNNRGNKPGNSTPVGQRMSVRDMFDRLSRNECVNLTSQIAPELDTAVLKFRDGFGDVWKGELRDGSKIQIRTWRTSMIEQCSEGTLEGAIKDIQTWSKMKHKNIHQLMGVAMPNGQYLGLITDRAGSGNLHEYMCSNPSFDRHQMCTQITIGLAYMHQSKMVHGDLKALNVFVYSGGIAKLSNFGLSALSATYIPFSETNNSRTEAVRWVAPELLAVGAPKTKESDIYALGMTLLEVITGEVPYPQCQWDFQVLSQVMQGELPPRPVELKDDESGNQMWELLMSCWNEDPNLRPSAKEVMTSLVMAATD